LRIADHIRFGEARAFLGDARSRLDLAFFPLISRVLLNWRMRLLPKGMARARICAPIHRIFITDLAARRGLLGLVPDDAGNSIQLNVIRL
jgi:hypothetical protein